MAMLLTACDVIGGKNNITSLLSAPQLSQTEGEIVKTIDTYLGENITIKYSKSMGYSSPVQFIDVNNDGVKEAFVFYYAPNKGASIRLAMLMDKDKKWEVVFDSEGLGSEVFYFDVAYMSKRPDAFQLVTGYSTTGIADGFMAIYYIENNQLVSEYSERCQMIAVGEMTQDGLDDIIVTSATQDNKIRVQLLSLNEDNSLTNTAVHYLAVPNVTITQLVVHEYSDKNNAIYIDYKDNNGNMYTEAGVFNGFNLETFTPEKNIARQWKYSFDLNSKDIDRDNRPDIPTVIKGGEDQPVGLELVEWVDFALTYPMRKYIGVCDTQTGLFIAIPDQWQGLVTLKIYEDGKRWAIISNETLIPLVTIKSVELGRLEDIPVDNSITVRLDTKRWQVVFSDDIDSELSEYIINSMITVN